MNGTERRRPTFRPRLRELTAAALLCLLLAGCTPKAETPQAVPGEEAAAPPETGPGLVLQEEREEFSAAPEAAQPAGEPAPAEEPEDGEEEPPAPQEEVPAPQAEEPPEPVPVPEDESWKLILVNAEHPIPEGYEFTLMELRNNHHVDERIYPELQRMFDDARAAGIYPFVNESYRTAGEQQAIMDEYIARYEAAGSDREEAERQAREIVALPGTSEHQLGLAVDLIAEFSADSWPTWQWLKDNCARYGFILRYPEGKAEITGIAYEPWHFRYVGAEAAAEIMERGLTLEEYAAEKTAEN